jgi:hypothetical protein
MHSQYFYPEASTVLNHQTKKIMNKRTINLSCIPNTAKFAVLFTAFCSTLSIASFAQPCKTNSLTINTGYNNITNTVVTAGNPDPNWTITAISSALANPSNTSNMPFPPATGPAVVTDNMSGIGGNNPNSQWVSINDPTGSSWSTWYWTLVNGSYSFTMKRTFTVLCFASDITYDIYIARDNFVKDFRVLDASNTVVKSLLNDPTITTNNPAYYNTFTHINTSNLSLPPGTYTMEITVHNLDNPLNQANPHGVNIVGTVSSTTDNLLAPGNDHCDCDCNDKCYWKVEGNNILNGNNIFGTLSNDNVLIKTNNTNRGTMTNIGLLGWNTINPTAYLHVNCNGHNPDGQEGQPATASDIRFENLEHGTGKILAIDASGYVYNTNVDITDIGGGGNPTGSFWDVTGNAVTPGNNFFGTNSPDDVILRTAGIDKGILTSGASGDPNDDGRLGWQTLNPTAHLHINCAGGNPEDGGNGSDVRFEELERGQGNIVVIDDQGYVYNSHIRLLDDGTIEMGGKKYMEENSKMEGMQNEIDALKAKLNELVNCCNASATNTQTISPEASKNALYQNTPNPFGKETVIGYNVVRMEQSAFIIIYDLNGRELYRLDIAKPGKGQVTVNADKLVAGMYLYSLVVDGQEMESKRMVLTK